MCCSIDLCFFGSLIWRYRICNSRLLTKNAVDQKRMGIIFKFSNPHKVFLLLKDRAPLFLATDFSPLGARALPEPQGTRARIVTVGVMCGLWSLPWMPRCSSDDSTVGLDRAVGSGGVDDVCWGAVVDFQWWMRHIVGDHGAFYPGVLSRPGWR